MSIFGKYNGGWFKDLAAGSWFLDNLDGETQVGMKIFHLDEKVGRRRDAFVILGIMDGEGAPPQAYWWHEHQPPGLVLGIQEQVSFVPGVEAPKVKGGIGQLYLGKHTVYLAAALHDHNDKTRVLIDMRSGRLHSNLIMNEEWKCAGWSVWLNDNPIQPRQILRGKIAAMQSKAA